jgi:tetratricopeptide (TPR) repeat protein
MNKLTLCALAAALLVAGGCKDKPKEVPAAARAQAATNSSEAEFALQVREFARAEKLLEEATQLDPEAANYWMQLGAVKKRQNKTSEARKAYERARELVQADYKRDNKSPAPLFAEIEICVLLGKPDEARKVLERAKRDHKDDPDVKAFVAGKVLEQMIESPQVKAVGL